MIFVDRRHSTTQMALEPRFFHQLCRAEAHVSSRVAPTECLLFLLDFTVGYLLRSGDEANYLT